MQNTKNTNRIRKNPKKHKFYKNPKKSQNFQICSKIKKIWKNLKKSKNNFFLQEI